MDEFDLTDEWIAKVRERAPQTLAATPGRARRVLMLSHCHGFQHWVAPHTAAVVKVLGECSDAFEVVETEDADAFEPECLAGFDGIVFNNTCPTRPRRDLFMDFVEDEQRAAMLRDSVLGFVAAGKGFIALHGGSLAYMSSPEWENLQGCTFDYHPTHQKVRLVPTEPEHPVVKAFEGAPFEHFDEPYLFMNKYGPLNVRPLLLMHSKEVVWFDDRPVPPDVCYAAWIKPYGRGRFFYCSPSHYPQSFEDPRLLAFLLDGIQYALGDLACDDTPLPVDQV